MTIDEAQTMLNARAKCIEKVCRGIYEDCNKENCDNCDLCYAQGTNGEQKELMLQCVEWLEELKVYQQHEIICHKGYNAGYNKAIDDFVEKIKLEYLGVHPDELYEKFYPSEICKRIKRIAEELSAKE